MNRPVFLPVRLVAALGALLGAASAVAQDQLEEITVTAQKRQQRLEEVGIAVTALSGEQVKELNLHNLTDIASQTPGLAIAAPLGETGNQNFTLRGVGLNDFSEHNESPVAVYQDGVYQATIAGINGTLFDVDRIEVLKGPQGTLYGRNSTGGLVQFVSKQPTANYEGYVGADYGSFAQKRIEGAVGGPISSNLQFRVSGLYDYHNGWGPSTVPGVKDSDGLNQSAGRAQLRFIASEDTSVLFNLHVTSNHSTGPAYKWLGSMYAANGWTQIQTPADVINPACPPGLGVVGPGTDCFGYRDRHSSPWIYDNNRQTFEHLDTNGAAITVSSRILDADFTSISAYEYVRKFYGEDSDAGSYPGLSVTNPVNSKELTQELRLSKKADRLFWTAGLYYFYRDIHAGSDTDQSGVGFVEDAFTDQLHSHSAAAFGQLEYSLTPQLTLIGGLRYSHENQNFSLLSVDRTGLTPVILGITTTPVPNYNVFPFTGGATANLTPYRDTQIDNLVTYRGELDWKPMEDFLVYGSLSKGTKSAGWNAAIDGSALIGFSTAQTMPYRPENLLAYEVGFKQLLKGIYRLSGAAFYYDYKDFQAFTFAGYTQQISNLPATVQGAELELTLMPEKHFELTLGGSYLSSRVKNVVIPVVGTSDTVTVDRHMVLAPTWSFNGSARYHFNIGEQQLGAQLDTHYTGRQYFDLDNDPVATQNGQAMTNGSVYFNAPRSGLRVSFWAKNLTNRGYRAYTVPVTALGFEQQVFAPPRWYGVSVGYTW